MQSNESAGLAYNYVLWFSFIFTFACKPEDRRMTKSEEQKVSRVSIDAETLNIHTFK